MSLSFYFCLLPCVFGLDVVAAATSKGGGLRDYVPPSPEQLGRRKLKQQRGIPFPYQRYIFWNDMDEDSVQSALMMSYNADSWELPYSNSIEFLWYETIELADEAFEGLVGLGFKEGKSKSVKYIQSYSNLEL